MHEVLVNRLGGLSLPRKSVVRLTDRPNMTLNVYRGRKTTKQQQHQEGICKVSGRSVVFSAFYADFCLCPKLVIITSLKMKLGSNKEHHQTMCTEKEP